MPEEKGPDKTQWAEGDKENTPHLGQIVRCKSYGLAFFFFFIASGSNKRGASLLKFDYLILACKIRPNSIQVGTTKSFPF